MPKLSIELIKEISDDIASGLNNKEACEVNDITESCMYKWISKAKEALDKAKSKRTEHQQLCVEFFQSLKKARHRRKQQRIQVLDTSDNVTGIIFLLRNEYPREYNRKPHAIPNFEKLEEYMVSEYTQAEIDAIRKAIFAAEDRRESEVEYDENIIFAEDGTGDNRD